MYKLCANKRGHILDLGLQLEKKNTSDPCYRRRGKPKFKDYLVNSPFKNTELPKKWF